MPVYVAQASTDRRHANGFCRLVVRGISQKDCAVAEPALGHQFQVQPHSIREEALSVTDDYREENHMELVYETGPHRMRGQIRPANGKFVLRLCLEAPEAFGSNSRSMRVRALCVSMRVCE